MLPEGTALGHLTYERVFVDYNGPQLFSARNESGALFFAVHLPDDEASEDPDGPARDNWLFVPVSDQRHNMVALAMIDLYSAFADAEWGIAFHVVYDAAGTRMAALPSRALPDDWLPERGEFLDPLPSSYEWNENLVLPKLLDVPPPILLDQRFQTPPPLEFDRTTPLWELDDAVIAALRAAKMSPTAAANHSRRTVVDLMFKKDTAHRVDLPASVLARVLAATQGVVEAFVEAAPGRRPGNQTRQLARLDAVATFPSSFGIRLDTHQADLMVQPDLVFALERLVELLAPELAVIDLARMLREMGRRPALRFRAFASAMLKGQADIIVDIGLVGFDEGRHAKLTHRGLARLVEVLDGEVMQTTETTTMIGRLVGVSLRTRFFRLEDDERALSGRIAEEFMPRMSGTVINGEYLATIQTVLEMNEATGEEVQHYTLMRLDPPPQASDPVAGTHAEL